MLLTYWQTKYLYLLLTFLLLAFWFELSKEQVLIKIPSQKFSSSIYFPLKLIFQTYPLASSVTYKEPSGPWANPHGLKMAWFGVAIFSFPAKPLANISQSPLGFPFLKGTNATKNPFCSRGARFHDP